MRGKPTDWWAEERAARERGFRLLCGIDEAGRGPLAGPVVAAAVILPFGEDLPGVRDSKTMTPEQRERAFAVIMERAEAVGVGAAEPAEIDSLNILRATHRAMRCALEALSRRPDAALIDGLPVYPFPIPQIALVKGDRRSASIAAASIVAKVTRDRMMKEYDTLYPQYGFAVHKGYPTPEHLARLAECGPCPIHRRSFAPVAAAEERGGITPPGHEGHEEDSGFGIPDSGDGRAVSPLQPSLFDPEDRQAVGESGEAVAVAHLRRLGWTVLATRYRCREGEIDVVAQDGESLVFVEVKARRGRESAPAEAVHARKRARMLAAAQAYLAVQGGRERACRFDVLEVRIGADGLASVRLIRGAFLAGE